MWLVAVQAHPCSRLLIPALFIAGINKGRE
jgi:hypothetical protein